MNKQRRHDGAVSHAVHGSTTPAIGSEGKGGCAQPIKNAVAARPKKQSYAPVKGAVSGKRKF